jgi:hypothetical protein
MSGTSSKDVISFDKKSTHNSNNNEEKSKTNISSSKVCFSIVLFVPCLCISAGASHPICMYVWYYQCGPAGNDVVWMSSFTYLTLLVDSIVSLTHQFQRPSFDERCERGSWSWRGQTQNGVETTPSRAPFLISFCHWLARSERSIQLYFYESKF